MSPASHKAQRVLFLESAVSFNQALNLYSDKIRRDRTVGVRLIRFHTAGRPCRPGLIITEGIYGCGQNISKD